MVLSPIGSHASSDPVFDRLGPVAVFDIDDTTNVFMEEYLKWRASRFATLVDDETVHDWLINRFIRESDPSVFRPTPGAAQALETIAGHYPILALSARDDDLHRHTYAQLEHHFPRIYRPEDLILVGHRNGTPRTSKLLALEQLSIIPAFIVEDNYRTALDFASAGIRAFHIGTEPKDASSHPFLVRFDDYEHAWKDITERVLSEYI
jgi:hypothetical protein